MAANFSINGVDIKNPSSFRIERYNITNLERRADGMIAGDLIAKKRKFFFTYEAITGPQLNTILNTIWETDDLFYELEYLESGVAKVATVYVGSIPTELHRAETNDDWVWKNVTFNLIEQ